MMKPNFLAACLLAGWAWTLPLTVTAADSLAASDEAASPAASLAGPADADSSLAQIVDDYRIGPSDLLEISVFQVPDLSRTVRVNARGGLTLPLIGEVQAGGLTSQQLEALIAQKLSKNYLQDPQVSVFIKEFVSQRVTVGGNVTKAGVFPISGKTTLLQAIAMAGGLDPLANESDITVMRSLTDGSRIVLNFDLTPIRKGEMPDPVLQTSDVIVVGQSGGRAALRDFTQIIQPLGILRWFF